MKVLQLIYTSCKKGLSSGAGFQTYSMSEDITEEERREIEQYGLYVPPTNLPTQPTPEEIEILFPVALRFFRLESGRFGICQSRYIGRDYSGRYGNYFCHALVLEQGRFPIYPIQLYKSPVFRGRLSENEINENTTPPPLPALDLESIVSAPIVHFDDVAEFITNTGVEPLKEMVSAVISYHETRRPLILADSQPNIPYWIAALQMAFPLKMAHQLTFATYIHDPAAINCTVSGVPKTGSRFAFSANQRNFENYIFDLDGIGTTGIDKEYKFTRNVDLGFTISRESLEEFHDFIDLFDLDSVNEELDSIDALFRMARVGLEGLTAEEILSAVEFANNNASPRVMGQLADSLNRILDSLSDKVDVNTAEIVARFLFKIARQSLDKKHLEAAYRFFFQSLDHLIVYDPHPNPEAIENFYCTIRDENVNHREEFAERALSDGRIKQITQYISNNREPLRTVIYFNLAALTIISFQYKWSFLMENYPMFKPFIKNSFTSLVSSEDHLDRALNAVGKDKDFFVEFISFCLSQRLVNQDIPGIFLNSYIRTMENKPTETAMSIRLKLLQNKYYKFIYLEYSTLLNRSTHRNESFNLYFQYIFSKDVDFLKQYFNRAVDDYLQLLTGKELFSACSDIIDNPGVITDDRVMKKVIEGFEKGILLAEPDKKNGKRLEEKLSELSDLKKKRHISTIPDVAGLALLGIKFEKAAAYGAYLEISGLIDTENFNLEQLDTGRVTEYYKWCLPNIIRSVRSAGDLRILFQWFGTPKMDKTFVLEYVEEIKKIIKKEDELGIDILVYFLEFYLSELIRDKEYRLVLERTHDGLVKILTRMSGSRFSSVRTRINRSMGVKQVRADFEWRNILREVEEKSNKSFFQRVKKVFGKKEKIKKNRKNRR